MKLTAALAVASSLAYQAQGAQLRTTDQGGEEYARALGGSVKTCNVPPDTDCSCAGATSTNVECVKLEKDGDIRQEWCADFDEGVYAHTNYNKQGVPSTSTMSIANYLSVSKDVGCSSTANSRSGSDDAQLWMTFGCNDTGDTTWQVGCGFTADWLRVDDLGLFVTFTPKNSPDSGSVSYWFGGQVCETDWTAGHLQVRDFTIATLTGNALDQGGGTTCSEPDSYSLGWDHEMDRSGGAITSVASGKYAGWSYISMNAYNNVGFTKTNCGSGDNVKQGRCCQSGSHFSPPPYETYGNGATCCDGADCCVNYHSSPFIPPSPDSGEICCTKGSPSSTGHFRNPARWYINDANEKILGELCFPNTQP